MESTCTSMGSLTLNLNISLFSDYPNCMELFLSFCQFSAAFLMQNLPADYPILLTVVFFTCIIYSF